MCDLRSARNGGAPATRAAEIRNHPSPLMELSGRAPALPASNSRPLLSAVAFFAGAAQGFGKRPAARLHHRPARRFRGGAGAIARRSLRLLLAAGFIVKT